MEKDYINCTLFVTFIIIVLLIFIKSFMTIIKLPFHIERSYTIDINDITTPIDDLSFNGIPATIYQSYDNNTKVTYNLVNIISDNVSYNSECEYYLFNNADKRLFIESNFDENIINEYDSLPSNDKHKLWIYCILYKNGGIYMDINCRLQMPILDIITPIMTKLQKNNNILFTMNNNNISNKLIIAPPNLPIFKDLIDSYVNHNNLSLSNLVNKYNYNDNIQFYVDNTIIKKIDTNDIIISIN